MMGGMVMWNWCDGEGDDAEGTLDTGQKAMRRRCDGDAKIPLTGGVEYRSRDLRRDAKPLGCVVVERAVEREWD